MLPAMSVAPASPPAPAAPAPSWPDQATDLIVSTVGTVRDKTTGPAVKIGRGIVYGTFAALVGLVAFVLFTVLLVRIVTVYLAGGRVWITDLAVGGLFSVAGFFLWSKAAKAAKGRG